MAELPKIYVSFAADRIDRLIEKARSLDDVGEVRKINQRVDLGQNVWRSWAIKWGGDIIEDCSLQVNSAALEELEDIRRQYEEKTESPVSVGIGMKMSEADKALEIAKHRGGDRVILWSDEMLPEYSEIVEKEDKPDDLTKSGFNAKMTQARPLSPSPEGSEHSQGEAMRSLVENNAPGSPEQTHSPEEIADFLHQMAAQEQGQEAAPQQDEHTEQIKQQVAQALQAVKEQIPVLEQVKQQAPDAYAAVVALANSVSMMARKLLGQPMAKNEKILIKSDDISFVDCDADGHTWGEDDAGPYCIMCGGDESILGHDEGIDSDERRKEQIEAQAKIDVEPPPTSFTLDKEEADPADDLDKATLRVNAVSGENQRHNVLLPVASTHPTGPNGRKAVAGRVKVLDQDSGTEKWRQVRAGQVMSPDGTPVSARNPKG